MHRSRSLIPHAFFVTLVSSVPLRAQQTGSGTEVSGTPAEEGFTASLSAGWDSHYIFRGEELSENVWWGQIELSVPLTENLSLMLQPWMVGSQRFDYEELDITALLTWTAGETEISAGYAQYFFLRGVEGDGEGYRDAGEIQASVTRSFGIIEATILGAWNANDGGIYLESSIGTSIELTKQVALEPAVTLGWNTDGYFDLSGLTHVALSLAVPVQLTEHLSLNPYIAFNLPLHALEGFQDERVFGGISISYTF